MTDGMFSEFPEAARRGDARAQAFFGLMYAYGYGVAKDREKAAFWLHKSAEQGDDLAQLVLGLNHETDDGIVAKDEEKAVYWYRKSAEQGNAFAQFALGVMYQAGRGTDRNEALADCWFLEARKQIGPDPIGSQDMPRNSAADPGTDSATADYLRQFQKY